MDKAVTYIQNRRSYLSTYLEDGRCSFSNNLSENAIRPFTVGRKNWLFCDTPNGAQASAIVYTMVEMAKANGVNVYHYLEYSNAIVHAFQRFRAPFSGKIVHIFPEQSAVI